MSTALGRELAALPVEQKLALMEELWESIPEQSVELSQDHIDTARRRLAELRADPSIGLTLEQLKARLA